MTEDLESMLSNGFQVWRSNLNIALPFLFDKIVQLLLLVSCSVVIVLFLNPLHPNILEVPQPFRPGYGNIADYAPNLINPQLLLLDIILLLVVLLLCLLSSSFFLAGAVGMSKTAIETRKTSLDEMIDFGKRNFLGLFLAEFIISLFTIILVLVLVGIPLLIEITLEVPFVGRAFIDLGSSLFTLLATLMAIVFAVVPFTIVISNRGAIDGLRKGCGFFMNNKLLVVLMWVFVGYVNKFIGYGIFFIAAIAFSLGILFVPIPSDMSSISYILQPLLMSLSIVFIVTIAVAVLVSLILSVFVVSPLTTVWWSRLYMTRIKSSTENDRVC